MFRFHFHYLQPFDTFSTLVFSKTGRLTTFQKVGARGVCVLCEGSTLVDASANKQPYPKLRSHTALITLVPKKTNMLGKQITAGQLTNHEGITDRKSVV